MGKLIDRLQRQLKNPDTKGDAEDCIKIYNWIKDTDPEGRVWESRWTPLVDVRWEGAYPNIEAIYKPTITGYTLLKGIECGEIMNKNTKQQEQKGNGVLPCVSGSFSFDDMANFAIWIKDNFSDEIAGAFARRSDGNLYWDEQVGELVKIWYENYR